MDLRGTCVVITGGARGLGLAFARAFLARGARVVLLDRDEAELIRAVATLGGDTVGHVLDVTDPAAVLALRDRIVAAGPVDVLVNNAGVVFGGSFAEVALAQHAATVEVNLTAVMAMTHAFLPHLESRPRAAILNVASASAFIALPFATSYAASKWGVLGFSEALDEELKERGMGHVQVSALCPSYVTTGMFDGATAATGTWLLAPDEVAEAGVRMVKRGTARKLLPWTSAVLLAGFAWIPRPLFHRIARLFGVSRSMAHWRGHGRRETR
jgi:all-trans-retinol dehydrogenase (NAD+)